MKSGINPLLRTPKSSIATLMAIVALMALIAACGEGDPEELTILPGAGHFELIVSTTNAWATVRDTILEMLER